MTDRDRKLLAIFGVVILLGGYWFLVLGKKRAAVSEAQSSKAAAQKSLDDAIASESAGKVEKKKYPVKYSRVLKMGKAIPVDADFASLLVQVNDISQESGVAFMSLTTTDGAATADASNGGPTGTTTCEAAVGSTGGTAGASASTGGTGATGAPAAPVQPSPAVSGVGKTINKAKAGEQTASGDANRASGSNADFAAKCASSPTLTDVTAQASGLKLISYNFTFNGSFYNLHKVFSGLLDMVKVHDGHLNVTGRLLQINTIDMSVKNFPILEATVDMTGYALPTGTTITAGATAAGPAGSADSASVSRSDSTVTSDAPPSAAILGGK